MSVRASLSGKHFISAPFLGVLEEGFVGLAERLKSFKGDSLLLTSLFHCQKKRPVLCIFLFWPLHKERFTVFYILKKQRRGPSSSDKYSSVFPSLFFLSPLLILHTTLIAAFTSHTDSQHFHHLYWFHSLSPSHTRAHSLLQGQMPQQR